MSMLAVSPTCRAAQASSYNVIYDFQPGTGAYSPYYGLTIDSSGNLFGVLYAPVGGVFELSSAGIETLLHVFGGQNDGSDVSSGVILDSAGNLYGETLEGGDFESGTIYKIAPDGSEAILYSFNSEKGTYYPVGGLTIDDAGNLYGMTQWGGGTCFGNDYTGCGAVFELSPTGTLTVLHAFKGGKKDGAYPSSNLIMDSSGNLYGATRGGGGTDCKNLGCGTVFKLAPNGKMTLLHRFSEDGKIDQNPNQVIMDGTGNLWGTTRSGGNMQCGSHPKVHCGSIFEIKKSSPFFVVHNFDGADGSVPSGLVLDKSGNFYGTTQAGGGSNSGTIFELTPAGALTTLYSLTGGSNGAVPVGMVEDSSGNMFGETAAGGVGQDDGCSYGCGTVFEFAP
jgi:uncharacterized repeat protein (TIGR03803 family)